MMCICYREGIDWADIEWVKTMLSAWISLKRFVHIKIRKIESYIGYHCSG